MTEFTINGFLVIYHSIQTNNLSSENLRGILSENESYIFNMHKTKS